MPFFLHVCDHVTYTLNVAEIQIHKTYIWYFCVSLHVGVLAKGSISLGEWVSQSIL